jgi:membrane fusion protein, multidrug efflux system
MKRSFVLLLLAAVPACQHASAADAGHGPAPLDVRLAAVSHEPIAHPVSGAGLVTARREMDLSFKVGGVVSQVRADVGTRVKRGQVLAVLDTTEVSAAVTQAAEGLHKAERDLERVEALHGRGSMPLAEVQNARTGVAVAKAGLAAAQFNVAHSVVTAPSDGVVDRRAVEPGEVVPGGKPVFHLSGTGTGWVVRMGLSDRDLFAVRLGAPCTVTVDALPGESVPCEISELASSASPGTGLFEVEALLKGGPELRAGATAKVQIAREVKLPSIPVAALVDGRGDAAAVFLVQEGKAVRRPVKVGFLYDDRAAIASGLDGAEQVVVEGSSRLREGSPARIAASTTP